MTDTAITYFQVIAAGDLGRAYGLLSPSFRSVQSQESFEAFWGGFDSVAIVGEAQAGPGEGSVTVPLSPRRSA